MAKDRISEERDGRVVGGKIDKSQKSSLCHLCHQKSEMVYHILSKY